MIKWIKDTLKIHDNNKDPKDVFKMMQNHEKCQIWFSSLIGFFYQHGIGCDINKNVALGLYLQIVNNESYEDSLNINYDNQMYLVN